MSNDVTEYRKVKVVEVVEKLVKLTPWFPIETPPVQAGVYERDYGKRDNPYLSPDYQYFDGALWYYGGKTVSSALSGYVRNDYIGFATERAWRGVVAGSY